MDLGFLFSGNTKRDTFMKHRDAVIEIIRRIPVSPRNNKVGYVMPNIFQPLQSNENTVIENLQTAKPPSTKVVDVKKTLDKSIELFQTKNGARDGTKKVLIAFVDDEALNFDVSSITPTLQELVNQGVRVVLLQPPNSLTLNLLPKDVRDYIQRADMDSKNVKSILDTLLNQLNEGYYLLYQFTILFR